MFALVRLGAGFAKNQHAKERQVDAVARACCRTDRGCRRRIGSAPRAFGLNRRAVRFIARANRNIPMLALGVIIAFVVILGAINYFEFGRVD